MLIVGLTGGIGAGKSIVAHVLSEMGYKVFNSDAEAKRIMDNDPTVRKQLTEILGEGAYSDSGLNRVFVAEKIFANKELREKMNAVVHPATRSAFEEYVKDPAYTKPVIFNEAAILFETGAYKRFDKIVLVVAPLELRVKRVMERDNSIESDIRARIEAQWNDEEKMKLADFIIVNDEKTPLLKQIEAVISELR